MTAACSAPEPGLAAEPAADVRGDRPARSLRSRPRISAGGAGEAVRHLGRHVDRQVVAGAVVAGDGGDGVALHRHDRDPLVLQLGPHHGGRAGERVGCRVAAHAGDQVGADLLELERGAVGQGRLGVDDRVERVVVDLDELGGVERPRPRSRRPPWPPPRRRSGPCPSASGGRAHAALRTMKPWNGAHAEVGGRQDGHHARAASGGGRCRWRPTRAWATGERTNATRASPSTRRLPIKVPRPVSRSGSSTRRTRVPRIDPGMPATYRGQSERGAGRPVNRPPIRRRPEGSPRRPAAAPPAPAIPRRRRGPPDRRGSREPADPGHGDPAASPGWSRSPAPRPGC